VVEVETNKTKVETTQLMNAAYFVVNKYLHTSNITVTFRP